MAVTFKDVARLAGVSTQTVSRVSNGADNVAESTRKRVNAAIKQLGYVPNKGAQMLSRANSQIIGIVSLDMSLHGIALIANGVRSQAHEMHYATALAVLSDNTLDSYREAIRELISQQVNAIIINAPVTRDMAINLVEQFKQLTLMFIDVPQDTPVNHVCCDHKMGASLAVQHLIDCQRQNFILISGPSASTASLMRLKQWQRDLTAQRRNIVASYEGDWTADSAFNAIKDAVFKNMAFDAVLVANDQMALGALCALAQVGIQVPKTVSVVGFDGIADSQFFSPPLSTIKQDFNTLGRRAVKLVLEQMQTANKHVVAETLPVYLIERNSSAMKQSQGFDKQEVLRLLDNIRRLL